MEARRQGYTLQSSTLQDSKYSIIVLQCNECTITVL